MVGGWGFSALKVGTAALLNVPESLEKVLKEIRARGYYLGEESIAGEVDGEAIVAALKVNENQQSYPVTFISNPLVVGFRGGVKRLLY